MKQLWIRVIQAAAMISQKCGYILLIAGIASLPALLAAGCYVYRFGPRLSDDHSRWGEFGDFLGGILNPTFGFIALLALFYTVYLQTRELQLSTEELRNSVSVLREQSRALDRQNFERTFFELVRLHHDIIKDLDFRRDDVVTASGRDCFRVFCKRFRALYDEAVETDALQKINTAYGAFHEKYGHEVGHYFRNLYRILRFVHESDATHKTHYTAILRAQLSSSELLLMYYGTLHDVGENLKPLAEAYALFDNLEPRLLYNYAVEVPLYDIAAWGGQSKTVARWYQTVS